MTPFQELVKASTEPPDQSMHANSIGASGWLLIILSMAFLTFLGWIIFSNHWLARGISNALMHLSV